MNFAILGPGSIAEDHAKTLTAIRERDPSMPLALRAVMGPEERAALDFAREHGAAYATTELDRVLDDPHLDAVVVCSPNHLHAEQSERCLQAGKHVLCEIPLAMSLEDTDRLIALADRVDRRLMVCHTQRFWPASLEARRRVEAGELHVHALLGRYLFLRRDTVNWKGRRRDWTDNALWHHTGHSVDLALWLLGAEAADVAAQVALPGEALGTPMDLSISLRTPRDQIATLVTSYNAHLPQHDYLLSGEENALLVAEDGLRDRHGPVDLKREAAIVRQDAEFIAAIRETREPAVSARSVRPAMQVLQAAQDQLDALLTQAGPGARHPRLP